MTCSQLAGVFRVIGKVLVLESSVFVADLAVGGDGGGIEGQLHLHVIRDGHERPRQLALEDLRVMTVL